MSRRSFYLQLILISLGTGIGIFLLNQFRELSEHQTLSWISLGFFILLSIVMYNMGIAAAKSDNKNQFTNVVMGITFFKMMLSLLLILAYNKLVEPDTKLFILPFFGIYLIYTIFEVWFMTKLGRIHT